MQGLRHHGAPSPRPRVKYGLTVGTVGHHLGKPQISPFCIEPSLSPTVII